MVPTCLLMMAHSACIRMRCMGVGAQGYTVSVGIREAEGGIGEGGIGGGAVGVVVEAEGASAREENAGRMRMYGVTTAGSYDKGGGGGGG